MYFEQYLNLELKSELCLSAGGLCPRDRCCKSPPPSPLIPPPFRPNHKFFKLGTVGVVFDYMYVD